MKNTWLTTHLIEERMTGHIKDVHFDFSITNLHSDNTHQKNIVLPAYHQTIT